MNAQDYRDQHPTPEAVFAMFHWHKEYAASRLGSMGFYALLSAPQRSYCADAAALIRAAAPVKENSK